MTLVQQADTRGLRATMVAGVLMLALSVGCREVQPTTIAMGVKPSLLPTIVLASGDTVELRFFYTPTLNVTQTVRPDGMIALQLVGQVQVAGLTPAALQEKLQELYQGKLVQPDVTVLVTSQQVRRVYVGGEVKAPGVVQMPAEMTVLEAIMLANGPKPDTAQLGNVIVVRYRDGKRLVCSVDLRPSLGMEAGKVGENDQPFYLQPMDIVYVPETKIVQADRWVDQHINKIVPVTGLFVTTTHGGTTAGYSSTR